MPIALPRPHLAALAGLASNVLERRNPDREPELLARDLLAAFEALCLNTGQDAALVDLDLDDAALVTGLVARLADKAMFDPRGPRNDRPRQLADCVIATLGLVAAESAAPSTPLTHEVRRDVTAAIASVIDRELSIPQVREAIVADARARCELRHHRAFDKLAAELDVSGQRLLKTLNLPLDAVQPIQRALVEARATVLERAARAAIDRAKDVLAAASPEVAERIDQPVTHRLTPRDVVIRRVTDPATPKAPDAVTRAIADTLTELAGISWDAPPEHARPYAVTTTYAVGDLVDHPKFGRGTVKTVAAQRVEIEFATGVNTLVHARK